MIEFRPQEGPQESAYRSLVDELLYGGAAFGGKTLWLATDVLKYILFSKFKAKIFRRTYPELNELITYAQEFYPSCGGQYRDGGHFWFFPSGATIRFCHMQNEEDWMGHAGESVPYFGFDELTTFTEKQYTSILPWNRTRDPEIPCVVRATTNPWGPGLGWVYDRFIAPVCIDGLPTNAIQHIETALPDGRIVEHQRQFIQAKYTDNKIGIDNNPSYVSKLMEEPDPEKRSAYMDGSWDIRPGQYFSTFRDRVHVISDDEAREKIKEMPVSRAGAMDWGGAAPLCYLWGIRFLETIIVEREHYEADLVGSEHVKLIKERTPKDEWPPFTVADPEMWYRKRRNLLRSEVALNEEFGRMMTGSPNFLHKANNKQIDGYAAIKQKLHFTADRKPRLFIARSCVNLIRELKQAEREDGEGKDPDKIKHDGRYHAIATLRYLVSHLVEPWVAEQQDVPPGSWEAEFQKNRDTGTYDSVFAR